MTPEANVVLSSHRRVLPFAPCFRDLIPPPSVEDALTVIRKGRAQLFEAGLLLPSAEVTDLAREIRAVVDELDQVRALLMARAEGLL